MDYYTIVAQRAILDREFTGCCVDTVRLKDFNTLYLGFEGDRALRLACIPDMPYLHTIEKRFIPRRDAQDWHLSRFAGKRLIEIARTPGDRILSFIFESGFRIVFEMTGRNANLIIVNPEGVISGATRIITGKESGFRSVRPGVAYAPPPSRDIPDLEDSSADELSELLDSRGGMVLPALAALCGGSKLFAVEALALAEIDPLSAVDSLSADANYRLFDAARELARIIGKGGEGGVVVMDGKEDFPRDIFPLPMAAATGRDRYYENLNDAVIDYSREREIALEHRSLRHLITGALDREERNLRTTMMKIERDRGEESEPERLERRANTILSSLHLLSRGMTVATLPDPWGEGMVEIELDPMLDGHANAQRLFIRARKLRDGAQVTEERISIIRDRLNEILAERERLASLEDIHALRVMAVRYARRNALSREQEEAERFPRRFISVSGLEIIVGRSDAENDELIRWARRSDVWLHAQGVGGSHVILRSPGKQMPDHRSIEQAASFAAYYSKAKTSAIVPVAWTLLKYVVKRKGQGPGQVTYTREKVVFVEPAKGKG